MNIYYLRRTKAFHKAFFPCYSHREILQEGEIRSLFYCYIVLYSGLVMPFLCLGFFFCLDLRLFLHLWVERLQHLFFFLSWIKIFYYIHIYTGVTYPVDQASFVEEFLNSWSHFNGFNSSFLQNARIWPGIRIWAQDTKHTAGPWVMGKSLWNISYLSKGSPWMPKEFTEGLSRSALCCQQFLCQ